RAEAKRLQSTTIEVWEGDALQSIDALQQDFDIVFIDPPYAEPQLRQQVFEKLEEKGCLKSGARVYFEWPSCEFFELPSSQLQWLKQKCAGRVNYAIAEWQGSR
ncbi:RsmD family RNA methyltransferase, partial [Gammaproteobacteria bacterium]|nr:RsmD family RNA methyltransferase [Gammaproteobacteria bacterium]